jgi:hypothetical protein
MIMFRPIARWAACLLPLALVLPAQAAPAVTLYRGDPASASGIRLAGWGSGLAIDSQTEAFTGARSLKVSVDGFYSGARLIFEQPIDLTPQIKDPNGYLELIVQFLPGRIKSLVGTSDFGGAYGAGGYGAPGGGYGAPGGGSGPGGLGPGSGPSSGPGGYPGGPGAPPGSGPGGYPGGGYPGGYGADGTGQAVQPDTRQLRAAMIFEGGQAVSGDHPVVTFPTPDPKWVRVAIPLTSFKTGRRLETYRLKELRLFGDSPDTFFVGEIRTLSDNDPISIDPLDEQVVAVGDRVDLIARAEAGVSALRYSWDFNAADGIQEDAVGPRANHTFRKPSPEGKPFVVTLTVTDLAGVKDPARITTSIEVIE